MPDMLNVPQDEPRAFGDVGSTRKNIFDNALKNAQSVEPLKNDLYTLHLGDVRYVGPEAFTKADQKRASLTRGSLARKMQGTWTLVDNKTNQPVATRQTTIANVPISDRLRHVREQRRRIHAGPSAAPGVPAFSLVRKKTANWSRT
jgi:hypothetical protein